MSGLTQELRGHFCLAHTVVVGVGTEIMLFDIEKGILSDIRTRQLTGE